MENDPRYQQMMAIARVNGLTNFGGMPNNAVGPNSKCKSLGASLLALLQDNCMLTRADGIVTKTVY